MHVARELSVLDTISGSEKCWILTVIVVLLEGICRALCDSKLSLTLAF